MRRSLAVVGLLASLLVIASMLACPAALASWTVPAAGTVVPAGCQATGSSGDAVAGGDGIARGFVRFEGGTCASPTIWYFQRSGSTWTAVASPYQGRVLAVADDGSTTYLLYAAADGTRITSRTHAGTFTAGRFVSSRAGRTGDVIAEAGRWWAVWAEAVGSGASLFQAKTLGTQLLRRRVTFSAVTDGHPSLARTGTGAVIGFDRAAAGRTDVYLGRTTTNGTWSLARHTSDGHSGRPALAVAGATAYLAWQGGPWIVEASGSWGSLHGHTFATRGTGPKVAVSAGRFFVAFSTAPTSGPAHVFLAERSGANWVGNDVTAAAPARETVVALTAAGGNATVLGAEAARLWAKTQTRPSTQAFGQLGAWVDRFDYDLDPAATVADLAGHGVRTLYLATARFDSPGDFHFPALVGQWLEQAHAAGIQVVGWYFPAYSEFLDADVRRTVAIASYRSPAGEAFDGLAVDIEFQGRTSGPAEFSQGVRTHLARVREGVGGAYPVGAIVPAPRGMALNPAAWAGFPWGDIGRSADVVLPMSYWSYRTDCPTNPAHCAYQYTRDNSADAARLTGLPVHVIGGVGDVVTTAGVADFVRAARDAHAFGGSLYDYKTTAPAFWPSLEQLSGR
jgi:hypothetical protein